MTQIESNFEPTDASAEKVFNFLCDFNNYKNFMPSQVSEWWNSSDEAKMKVQGLGALHLKKDITRANSYIKVVPIGHTPVELYLEWHIAEDGNNSKVKACINAELNMFMRMVAEKPLKKLVDSMAAMVNGALTEK